MLPLRVTRIVPLSVPGSAAQTSDAKVVIIVGATHSATTKYRGYADQAYAIAYTRELEEELTRTLESMRADLGRSLDRSHESPERCRACGFREDCDQALA